MNDQKINLKCSQIRDYIEKDSKDKMWQNYMLQAKQFQGIWENAILKFSSIILVENSKVEKHIEVVKNTFSLMDDWYYNRSKLVKARRNEIDSAISFIRNNALNRQISYLIMAPVMRNLASLLRGLLNISTKSYSEEQIPLVIAQGIFDIAAVRVLFPVELANLVWYLPHETTIRGEGGNVDNYHIALERGSHMLGLDKQLDALYKEANLIWSSFDDPKPFSIQDSLWSVKGGEISSKIYFDSLKEFHSIK